MAKFETALQLTLKHEGGYSNLASDTETYCGITRKNNPRWVGWNIIDKNKPLKQGQKIESGELTVALAAIYKVEYWNKMWGENIKSQKVANFLFDWFVNSGYHAITAIQQIVDTRPDGVMGSSTIKAINNFTGDLLGLLLKARMQFVKNIVRNSQSKEVFLNGWVNRIESFNENRA